MRRKRTISLLAAVLAVSMAVSASAADFGSQEYVSESTADSNPGDGFGTEEAGAPVLEETDKTYGDAADFIQEPNGENPGESHFSDETEPEEGSFTEEVNPEEDIFTEGEEDSEDSEWEDPEFPTSKDKKDEAGIIYRELEDGTLQVFRYSGQAAEVEIPSVFDGKAVTSIKRDAFRCAETLVRLRIPESVVSIEPSAFKECYSLEEINVSDDNPVYRSENGIIFTKDSGTFVVFPPGKQMSSYTIPYGVTAIAPAGFMTCERLTEVVVPDTVQVIGEEAFAFCTSLSAVNIPMGVTEIGDRMFARCISLREITLPESLTYIGRETFVFCSGLTGIAIPSGVTKIGMDAFNRCTGLRTVEIPASVAMMESTVFYATHLESVRILNPSCVLWEDTFPVSAKIYGYNGSTAQTYAMESGNVFISLDVRKPASAKLNKPQVVWGDRLKVSWESVPGADGYIVYKKISGKWKSVKNVSSTTLSYTDKYTKIGNSYQYTVKAYSNSVKGTIYGAYDKKGVTAIQTYYVNEPLKFQVKTLSTRAAKLTWTERSKATGYLIYRKSPGGSWKRLKIVGNTSSYTDYTCKSASTYFYTVRAYTKRGNKYYYSPYSKTGSAVTTKMLTPKVKAESKAAGKVTVTWSKQSRISGYVIYRRTSPTNRWERLAVVSNKKGSYIDEKAKSKWIYQYTVRPYKKAAPSKGIPKTLYGPFYEDGVTVEVL